ncbi:Lipase-3 domain-containing protein [Fusarium sp. LHS14.1]|nr:Lipase-3 domain-containing protein [Fusarium sp. LHS14.1]
MGISSSKSRTRGPSSSAISANNSRGASVAAVELSSAVHETLSELDLEGSLSGQFKQLLQRLDQEASKYTNSRVSDDGASTDWNCSRAEAQLVSAAWKCARGTYDLESTIEDTAYCTFRKDHVLKHSLTRTVKALKSTVVEPVAQPGLDDHLLPALVIAVRGSASKMDHIVNANSRPRATEMFISPNFLDEPDLMAHSGFLNSAWVLDDIVSERIKNYIENAKNTNGQRPHVLFTGHSAGGAVAALFYVRYISYKAFDESTRFSCVTFGAPPCVSAPVDISRYRCTGATLCLNIINEFDVVSRADKPYILSLVELSRAVLRTVPLPPVPSTNETPSETDRGITVKDEIDSLSPVSTQSTGLEKKLINTATNVWNPPEPSYHHVGPRIVFVMRLHEGTMSLRAVQVPPTEFQTLLFCRTAVHGKARYGERVEMLESGRFNGRAGWDDKL